MKSPKAKEAVFLNSFGVAIGRAIMMARQSLHYSRHQQSLERSKVVVCSQDIECNVHTLKSGDYRRRKRRNDPVADEHSGEYSTEYGFSFCFSMSARMFPYYVCPVVGMKASSVPMDTAAISCTAQPQSIEASPAIRPIEFESTQKQAADDEMTITRIRKFGEVLRTADSPR